MKSILYFLLAATALLAGEAKPDVKAAVTAAEKKWVDAVVHADIPALEKLMSADILYTHSSASTQTRADFIAALAKTKYLSIEFSDEVIRQFGNTAVVTHKAVFNNATSGKSNLYVTEVWAHQGGGWQMVSRQATKLP